MPESSTTLEIIFETLSLVRQGLLDAPAEFTKCPARTLKTICNGCGAESSKFDFVPDTMYGLYIGYACMIHDFEYEKGVTSEHKRIADLRFRDNMRAIINKESNWVMRYPRLIRADMYYKAVDIRGYDAFFPKKPSES